MNIARLSYVSVEFLASEIMIRFCVKHTVFGVWNSNFECTTAMNEPEIKFWGKRWIDSLASATDSIAEETAPFVA